ncbi:hypothetical protein [Arthrobacter sp. JSM 101049]|uniref:hypothetical protein n=1 Tax=Arthrobacter sp. JSM 101049 TaxID=929097 RepID=UPI00356A4B47
MRQTYKILAHLIAAAVVIQAALIAWTTFIVINTLESGAEVSGPPAAAMIHGTIGMYVIPILVLALLVVALIARAGVRWALWLVLAVVVQVALALAAFSTPVLGLLHGLVAFGILALAEVGVWSMAHAPTREPAVAQVRPAH